MKKTDFDFVLPLEQIAQAPLTERSASRLLRLDAAQEQLEDLRFRDLPQQLQAGDLLIFNDTKVLPARLYGRKPSGGAVELLIERICDAHEAVVQLKVSKKPASGALIELADGSTAQMLGREGEAFFRLRFATPLSELLSRLGEMPLPPYIARAAGEADRERYQTIYAREPGAVAAPTAGLHFDSALLAQLRAMGVNFGYVTLHVGAGTFQPVRAQRLEDHVMHSEWLSVSAELVKAIERTRAQDRRVIAVGTTVVRALESALQNGKLAPFQGETRIFIYPGYAITSIDGLITNFHLPQSTLLMLVSALAGRERVLEAYRHAVVKGYRFFSYGDAMLIWPRLDA